MSRVFSYLDTREVGKRTYQLLDNFKRVKDPVLGDVVAQVGFVTNYASIDMLHNLFLGILWALLKGYGDKSATLHDWLYTGYGILQADGTRYYPTRLECDQFFFRALRAEGVARWRAYIFYYGVRWFGEKNFSLLKTEYEPVAIAQWDDSLLVA